MIFHCILLVAVWKSNNCSCLVQILVGCTGKQAQTLPGDDVVYLSYQLIQTQQLLITCFLSLFGICADVGEAQTCPGPWQGYITQLTEQLSLALGRGGEEFSIQSNKVGLFYFQLVFFYNKIVFVCSHSQEKLKLERMNPEYQ